MTDRTNNERQKRYITRLKAAAAAVPALQQRVAELEAQIKKLAPKRKKLR
jgi:hypothetical protein